MNPVKITSENADAIADFMAEFQDHLEGWAQIQGYMEDDVEQLLTDWEAIRAHLICILGEESGTGFRVEIK